MFARWLSKLGASFTLDHNLNIWAHFISVVYSPIHRYLGESSGAQWSEEVTKPVFEISNFQKDTNLLEAIGCTFTSKIAMK